MSTVVTDSDRLWASAFVESCRYVAEHTGQPFNEAAVTQEIRNALTNPRPLPLVYDSGFEVAGVDMGHSRDDDEQADRAADREWAARWESRG